MSRKEKTFGGVANWCSVHEGFVFCVISFIVLVIVIVFAYTVEYLQSDRIVFSVKNGFYDEDIKVKINREGLFGGTRGTIRYNLNGDDLRVASEKYEGAINMQVPNYGYRLYTVTAAICFSEEDCMEPSVATYVLGKNLHDDVTLDVVSLTSSQKSLYDYETGIMVEGRKYDEVAEENEEEALKKRNYLQRGKKWIRSGHLTILSRDGVEKYNDDIGVGISGGTSPAFDLKSFKVIANDNTPFVEIYNGRSFSNSSLRLHTGSQDQFSGKIRSTVASRLANEAGFDGCTDTKRVILFLNGDYYGVADVQQSYSDDDLATWFSVDANGIEKRKGAETVVLQDFGLTDMFKANLNIEENRKALETVVDMDDYLEYYAIQIMLNNTDWPGNNFEAWRTLTSSNNDDNKYNDGRLRFLMYDLDLIYYAEGNIKWWDGSIGDIFVNLMENKYNGYGSSFRSVVESKYYREKLIDILGDLVNGPFKTENVLRVISEEEEKIDHQIELFHTTKEYEEWKGWIDLMKKAASKREGEVRADAKKYFGVDL